MSVSVYTGKLSYSVLGLRKLILEKNCFENKEKVYKLVILLVVFDLTLFERNYQIKLTKNLKNRYIVRQVISNQIILNFHFYSNKFSEIVHVENNFLNNDTWAKLVIFKIILVNLHVLVSLCKDQKFLHTYWCSFAWRSIYQSFKHKNVLVCLQQSKEITLENDE